MACPFFVEEMVGLQQIDAGTGGLVDLALIKAQLSVESDDWDALLEAYIAAAVAYVENFTGRALGVQQWELSLPGFTDPIVLARGPVTQVDAITYLDADRIERALAPETYIADLISDPQSVVLDPDASWPDTAGVPNAVTVTFSTGYAAAPAPILQAILLIVASWFANREGGEVPMAAAALLRPYRKVVI